MEKIRISKYFTDCGVMSRRAAEAEIAAGRVSVNGAVASLGDKIDPEADTVTLNGKTVKPRCEKRVCVMLNKPRGIVCSASDEKGRTGVTDICRARDEYGNPIRLYPIGRLDMDSDGLLLLTNDGELANKLTHPKHSVPKIYHVTLRGRIPQDLLSALGEPIVIDGRLTMPVNVGLVRYEGECTVASFELFEGRNRQIRRMCDERGVKIAKLSRVSIGKLNLGELEVGSWRYLTADEIKYLRDV